MTILHIAISEKFLPPFIDLVDNHFDSNDHFYAFITSEKYEYGLKPADNMAFFHTDSDFHALEQRLACADKIILHGLWRDKVNDILVRHPEWFTKVYWFMWGGEFYYPEKYKEAHKAVIKNAAYLVSGVKGDIDLVRNTYGATGEFIEGWIYAKQHSLSFSPYTDTKEKCSVLLGNSADPSNQHLDAMKKLCHFDAQFSHVHVPLSYGGTPDYREEVVKRGIELLPDSFSPLTRFMQLDDYLALLSTIDIAVFNHRRQQAINNILVLLELGKKVYCRKDVSTYKTLKDKGFQVYDIDEFSLARLPVDIAEGNAVKANSLRSESTIVSVLKNIFYNH